MQDNQTELETTAAANDTSCSCPSARELAVTTGLHLLAAAAAFILFSRTHVTTIAPATAEELKTYLSCLQKALNKSSHS